MTEITGNTYPVRERLRALGGRPSLRGNVWVWLVPDEKADEARRIVASTGPTARRCGGVRGRKQLFCETCRAKINYGRFCGKCEFSR